MSISIYVGNLPFSTDEACLESLFSPFGEVTSAKVMSDRETGRSRGFGFVEMEASAGRTAMQSLDGSDYKGRTLRVNEAEKRTARY